MYLIFDLLGNDILDFWVSHISISHCWKFISQRGLHFICRNLDPWQFPAVWILASLSKPGSFCLSRSRLFPYIWSPLCWKCVPRDLDLFKWNSSPRNPWDAGAITDGTVPLLSFLLRYQVFWINMKGMILAKYGPMHLSVGRAQNSLREYLSLHRTKQKRDHKVALTR